MKSNETSREIDGSPTDDDEDYIEESLREQILGYWDSDLTQAEIGAKCRCRHSKVPKVFREAYGEKALEMRQKYTVSKRKLGANNPMFGKTGENHHNYIGRASDHKGYYTVVRPPWYYSRARRVFEHHVVYCEHNNLKCIPEGMEVHHLDFDPSNNNIENLILLSKGDHIKLHRFLNKTGIRNDYPNKGVDSSESKRETSQVDDEIV